MGSKINDFETEYKLFLEEYSKFEEGNGSAGRRARKSLQKIKKLAQSLRVDIQTVKNQRKK